jgi:protease PrsW
MSSDNHVGIGLSVVAAASPILVYLIVIWWLDRYEREPLWLVALTFLYGAVGAIALGILLSVTVMIATDSHDVGFSAAVVAPLTEEPSKGLIVFLLLLTRHFDNTTDGVIYGAASGLGFAMTENFIYFVQVDALHGADAWEKTVMLRSLFTALMHCAATASFGAMLGRFRYRGGVQQWLLAPLLGLAVAMTLHATFNGVLVYSASSHDNGFALLAYGLIPMAATTLIAVTLESLVREHKMLAAELREEAAAGLLPAAHADILPFHRRRWRHGWLDPKIDKKRYIQAATLLAFRKWQSKLPTGKRPYIEADIVRLRHEVASLLKLATQ